MTTMTRLLTGLALLGLLLSLTPGAFAAKGGGGGGGGKPGGGGGGEDPPAASPEITYFASKGDKVMVMDADGANATVVLGSVSGFSPQGSWSPDGTRLVFNATIDGAGIYVVNLDGTGLTKLTTTATQYVNRPVWSPVSTADGGHKILFEDQASNGTRDLFLMDPDGSNRVNLTNSSATDETHPAWNPTATKIAAVLEHEIGSTWGDDVVSYDLALVDGSLSLSAPTNLTVGTTLGHGDHAWLDWARVDDQLAVSSYDEGGNDWDIWLVDTAGVDDPVNLTSTDGVWERQPAWSPDDSAIAYWHDGGRKKVGIYVKSLSGGDPTKLVSDAQAPSWRR